MTNASNPVLPSSTPGASTPPGAVQACPYAAGSEILIIDEIGLPLANTAVTLWPSGGGTLSATTDASGKVCLSLPPGTSIQVEVAQVHEVAPGDSTTTSSGRHFAANGAGP